LLIAVGAAAVARWHWVLYGLGVLLVFTGFKMLFGGDEAASIEPERNPVVRMVRRFFPVTESFVGESFATLSGGRWMLTPQAIVLIVVETTDVAFAIDSIPAIFGITRDAFLVFTSNIFAILGLRSLYFVLAAIMDYFRLLKHALALALVVIGVKMVFEIPLTRWLGPSLDSVSLMLVLGIIGLSIVGSLVLSLLDRLTGKSPPP
jgi:tellurite resistance protein TerC